MEDAQKKERSANRRKTFLYLLGGCMMLALTALVIDFSISSETAKQIYHELEKVPKKNAALVLGTAPKTEGRVNAFYRLRLDAAEALFKARKVRALVISGDSSRKDYDEPSAMKADLIKRGIPSQYITLDYAGFRTLDSIVRAKEIFDLDDYIVISQPFHCERALYIANAYGHKASAYVAQDVKGTSGHKVRLREVLARCKAFLDVNILGTDPKFLGEKEKVTYKN